MTGLSSRTILYLVAGCVAFTVLTYTVYKVVDKRDKARK